MGETGVIFTAGVGVMLLYPLADRTDAVVDTRQLTMTRPLTMRSPRRFERKRLVNKKNAMRMPENLILRC